MKALILAITICSIFCFGCKDRGVVPVGSGLQYSKGWQFDHWHSGDNQMKYNDSNIKCVLTFDETKVMINGGGQYIGNYSENNGKLVAAITKASEDNFPIPNWILNCMAVVNASDLFEITDSSLILKKEGGYYGYFKKVD